VLARRFFHSLAEDADRKKIRELIAVYSVSFGRRDMERQWIKYADTGRGVALGLAPEFFGPDDSDSEKPEELTHCGKVFYGAKDGHLRHEGVIDDAFAVIERVQRRGWLNSAKDAATFCHLLRVTMYTEILWNSVTTKHGTWSYQNEMRLLLLDSLKKPKLLVVNPERPRVELIQPRLKPSVVEVMVGPNADAGVLKRVRDGLAARGMGRVLVTQARSR
jgi:Protein of unknown function (DUF2971)